MSNFRIFIYKPLNMKIQARVLAVIVVLILLTGCGTFKVSTLNYDPIYDGDGNEIELNIVDNEFELNRLIRDDFNFRYNFGQYAKRQPYNSIINNRYFRNFRRANGYPFYASIWNQDQFWDAWIWDYPFYNNSSFGMGWSYSWNNRRWSSNQWGNPYGWNNYYGWNSGYNHYNNWNYRANYNNRRNTSYIKGRRGSTAYTGTVGSTIVNVRPRIERSIDKVTRKLREKNIEVRVINNPNNNDQTIRLNTRSIRSSESGNNGGGSRIRQNLPPKAIVPNKPRTIQPRQVYRRPVSSVPQQPRSSSETNNQRRTRSSRKQN